MRARERGRTRARRIAAKLTDIVIDRLFLAQGARKKDMCGGGKHAAAAADVKAKISPEIKERVGKIEGGESDICRYERAGKRR